MENDNVKIKKSKYFLELEENFGKYGSWALWDEDDGTIEKIIKNESFESFIKPNIVFVGLNASMELPENWINYHSECCGFGKIKSWKRSPVHKLAEVLREKEFEIFKGAYMTDIIKNQYDSSSKVVKEKIKQDKNIVPENIKLFEDEQKALSKISGSTQFHIICIGDESFKHISQTGKNNIYKIYHYANWGEEKVKDRTRQDLREVIGKIKQKK